MSEGIIEPPWKELLWSTFPAFLPAGESCAVSSGQEAPLVPAVQTHTGGSWRRWPALHRMCPSVPLCVSIMRFHMAMCGLQRGLMAAHTLRHTLTHYCIWEFFLKHIKHYTVCMNSGRDTHTHTNNHTHACKYGCKACSTTVCVTEEAEGAVIFRLCDTEVLPVWSSQSHGTVMLMEDALLLTVYIVK